MQFIRGEVKTALAGKNHAVGGINPAALYGNRNKITDNCYR